MTAKFNELAAKMIADLIRDYKLRAFQAAAFPGNAGEESGGFTKLQEQDPKSGRGGLGFFQDTGPRRVAFEQWIARNADKHYSAGDYAANYSFLVRELDGSESRVLTPLRAATTIEEATEIVMRVFERPYLPTAHLEVRIDYARKALAAFQATGQSEDELRAQGRPGGADELPSVTKPPALKTEFNVEQLMPLILGVLSMLQKQKEAATGKTPDIMELLTGLLQSGLQPPTPVIVQQPAPVAVAPKPAISPSVGLGLTGVLGSFAAMATGHLGTPLGMGQNPTAAGNIVPLIFAAIPFVASFFGPVGSAIGRVVSVAGPAILNWPQQPPSK